VTPAFSRVAAHRIARAVVSAEVRRLKDTDTPAPHEWPEDLPIGDEGLGLDSLEQLGALSALAETFGLDDASLGPEPPQTVGGWVDLVMRQHASGNGHLSVMTSGSSGRPRSCRHGMAELVEEACVLAARIPRRTRVVALVPAHHLYGIICTALLPAVLDVPVVTRVIGAPLDLTEGDLVVAVPDQWPAILRLTRDSPADVVGISSAGPLDETLAVNLLRAGLGRLFDIYGSSETGGIAIRELPATAYALLPRWHLLPHGENDWQLGDAHGIRRDLPDYISRDGERQLRPIGRRDGAVQIGGHNVWPGRVTDILRQIDGVADAAVRQDTGGRLKAFIVPYDRVDPAELVVVIQRVAADRLSAFERPRSLRFGSALPRNMMGKLEDWA
jgi:4-coumarate--CoA ligase